MHSPSKEEVKAAKFNAEVILLVQQQIIKDFHWYDENISFEPTNDLPYDSLLRNVLPIVDRMLNLDSSRFFSLLYAIDVDERKIKQVLLGTEELNASEEITHIILHREILKVLTRQAFSASFNSRNRMN